MNAIEWWTMLPFCLMLLCIAVLPLCASHWWENNVHKLHISLLWSLPTAVYLIVIGTFSATTIDTIYHSISRNDKTNPFTIAFT